MALIEVSRDSFFEFLKRDPRDIMPSLTDPSYSNWETKGREVVGRTYPGWRNPGDEKKYLLIESAIKTV